MNMTTHIPTNRNQEVYMLNSLIGIRVMLHGKKIGTISDIIMEMKSPLPVITHLYVGRLFGSLSLMIPWDNVLSITSEEAVINIPDIRSYEKEPEIHQIKLKDHILDKKVLDMEERDVDVVYDVRLVMTNNRLYVSDVDISVSGFLRRMGLGFLTRIINNNSQRGKLIPWKYIQPLPAPLGRFRGDVKLTILKEKLSEIHPVDLADILEEMDSKQRAVVFKELDTQKASATFEEIDPKSQRELVSALDKNKVVQLLTHMTSGQAADILSVLPFSEVRDILKLMDKWHVDKIKSIMQKQEEDIVNYATSRFIRFPPDMSVGQAKKDYYEVAKNKKVVMYLYIIDDKNILQGVIDIKELLQAKDEKKLVDVETNSIIALSPKSTLRQAFVMFERYDYRAIPIVDEQNKILGVLSYRDLKRLKHRFLE